GTYFACTAFGLLTGQLLPPSVGAAAARSAGVKLLGGTIVQATSATAFEQVFDAALACWCAAATLATIALHLAPAAWLLATAVACALGVLSTLLATRRLSTLLVRDDPGAGPASRFGRLRQWVAARVSWQALLDPALTWRLVALSACRYGALIVSAYAAALAGDLPVALWQVAAVMPLAVLTVLVSFVPAGLGVNEWTFASALTVLGVPFATAAEFALLNRFLNVLGAVAIAALGGAVLVASGHRPTSVALRRST
ncbi:MAG TPA: lysylphosphatidylglycerol synthase domain-containing protein, partial [Acidisphaera sp.]|nr:lysylphosphatidylglycerol synthase domain-containing protein [Acidisphaera sp.]